MKKIFKLTGIMLAVLMAFQSATVFANKKFTREELEAKKAELKEAKVEAKAYFKEIKEGFAAADKDVKKKILSEIAVIKAELKDDSIGVFVRGKEIDFDKYDGVKPRIENGRTLVPIRAITEALDAVILWDEATQGITITAGENEIKLVIGSTTVLVNGEETECEAAPVIENGRTLVPLRIVSEALREKVEWDGVSRTVIIEKQEEEQVPAEEIIEGNFDVEDYEDRTLEEIMAEEENKVYEDEPTAEELEMGIVEEEEEIPEEE